MGVGRLSVQAVSGNVIIGFWDSSDIVHNIRASANGALLAAAAMAACTRHKLNRAHSH